VCEPNSIKKVFITDITVRDFLCARAEIERLIQEESEIQWESLKRDKYHEELMVDPVSLAKSKVLDFNSRNLPSYECVERRLGSSAEYRQLIEEIENDEDLSWLVDKHDCGSFNKQQCEHLLVRLRVIASHDDDEYLKFAEEYGNPNRKRQRTS